MLLLLLSHVFNRIEELETSADVRIRPEEIDLLRLEENTWALLQAVMPLVSFFLCPACSDCISQDRARKTEHPTFEYARDILQQNPYTPTSTIAQAILNASPVLTELIVVREWLQETAPPPIHLEATTGYWKFTKHNIMQTLRTGAGTRDGLVKDMDPDAVNRGDGRSLAADDSVRANLLLFSLHNLNNIGCRAMRRALHKLCMVTFELAGLKMLSNYAGKPINPGEPQVYGALFFFTGRL